MRNYIAITVNVLRERERDVRFCVISMHSVGSNIGIAGHLCLK